MEHQVSRRASDKWLKANFIALIGLLVSTIFFGLRMAVVAGGVLEKIDSFDNRLNRLECKLFDGCGTASYNRRP